jgi:hypothetical protein
MTQVTPRFKAEKAPKRREPNAASKRPGMSPKYLHAIKRMPSCLSGRKPCDPHHLRCGPAAKERGVSLKATDRWAVPLTRDEHEMVHKLGGTVEFDWFRVRGINVLELATALWAAFPDEERMLRIIQAHRGSRHE